MKVMKFETAQIQFSSDIFAAVAVVVAQGDVTGDDNFATTISCATQHYSTVATLFRRLQHCSNIATLCCAKNRCGKSSRVTSHLACSSTLSDSGKDAKVKGTRKKSAGPTFSEPGAGYITLSSFISSLFRGRELRKREHGNKT